MALPTAQLIIRWSCCAVIVFATVAHGLENNGHWNYKHASIVSKKTSIKHFPLVQPVTAKNPIQDNWHSYFYRAPADFGKPFTWHDKEVVDHLTKQWAPIVWLAPQEKFMPIGVDEFLNHVHPTMDKGKSFMMAIPMGENSKSAYLVTNDDIDKLLDNESSFIYGRNPNETPVPIYAAIMLCSQEFTYSSNENTDLPLQKMPFTNVMLANTAKEPPYIPVSINHNLTSPHSARLYSELKRIRRNSIMQPELSTYHDNAPMSVLTRFGANNDKFVVSQTTSEALDEVTVLPLQVLTASESEPTVPSHSTKNGEQQSNNFIANLADNVKFSWFINEEQENYINLSSHDHNSKGTPNPHDRGQKVPSFYVTYWMFYPYSQGKSVCTLNLGPLGHIPFPSVYGYCLGQLKDIGSHIGDWEHMSLYFGGGTEPDAMYVSAHDAGAFYTYNKLTGSFEFKNQETRKGILQRPNFPKTVTTFNDHPVLFAAKGSHGLWTAPGKHRFVKVARLYDINGFGTSWNTWKTIEISYENLQSYGQSLLPTWLSFKGKWGNPKSKCHPFRRIGLNFCEYTDGPTGIPQKEPHFQCGLTYSRS